MVSVVQVVNVVFRTFFHTGDNDDDEGERIGNSLVEILTLKIV